MSEKLVRDNIPGIIERETGVAPQTRVVQGGEYRRFLLEKIVEEACELRAHPCIEEAADLAEALETFCAEAGMGIIDILTEKRRKAKEKGGFKKKIVLVQNTPPG